MAKNGNSNVLIIGVEDIVKAQHSNPRDHPAVPKAYQSTIKQVLMTEYFQSGELNPTSNLLDIKRDDHRQQQFRMSKQKGGNSGLRQTAYEREKTDTPSLLVRKRPVKHHRYEMLTQHNFSNTHSPSGNASANVFKSVMNSLDVGQTAKMQKKKLGRLWKERKRDGRSHYSRCVFEIPLPKEFTPEHRHYSQYKTNQTNQYNNNSDLFIRALPQRRNHTLQSIEIGLGLKGQQREKESRNQFRPRCTNTSIKFLKRPTNGSNFAAGRLQKRMTSFSNNIQLEVSEMKLNYKERPERIDKQFLERLRQTQKTAYNRSRSHSIVTTTQPQQTTAIHKRSETYISPWLDIFQDFHEF